MINKITKNRLKVLANLIYCNIEDINTKLMHKSDNENNLGKETFEQVMDFYITSHAMSFLKNICLDLEKSLGTILNMRCILEGKALLEYYNKNSLTDKQLELFKIQYKIIEYKKYKEFFDMTGVVFKEDLANEFEETKKIFIENTNSDINLKQVFKTQFPCLLMEHFSFEKIIKEYLSEDELYMYKTCSQFIHPNDNTTLYQLDITNYYAFILNYIITKYLDLNNLQIAETFKYKYNKCTNMPNSISLNIKDIVNRQVKELEKIISVFDKFYKNNYVGNSLKIWIDLMKDITSDSLFGLSEQVKIKWKPILENLAIMDYQYNIAQDYNTVNKKYIQMVLHTKKQLLTNNGEEVDYQEIYKNYLSLYPSGLDIEKFKICFKSTLGFLTNDNGLKDTNNNIINLTYLIDQFLFNFKNANNDPAHDWSKIMKLNYIESQILSHSNGYMYYSNTGAWKDCDSVLIAFDYSIYFNMNKILKNYKLHANIEQTKEYKTLINCLRNSLKHFKELFIKKHILMQSVCKIDRC